jgi:hypothetical protein
MYSSGQFMREIIFSKCDALSTTMTHKDYFALNGTNLRHQTRTIGASNIDTDEVEHAQL